MLIAALQRLVKKDVLLLHHRIERARLLSRDVHLELQTAQARAQALSDSRSELCTRQGQRALGYISCLDIAGIDQAPLEAAGDHVGPGLAQNAKVGILVLRPPINFTQERPLVQLPELRQPLQRVAPKHAVDGGREYLAELEIDPSDGPVEIDLVVQIEPGVQKHEQRLGAVTV